MKQKVTNVNNETNTVTVELEFEDLKKIDMDLLTKCIEVPAIPFEYFPHCVYEHAELFDVNNKALNMFEIKLNLIDSDENTQALMIKLLNNNKPYFYVDKQHAQFDNELSKTYWKNYCVGYEYNDNEIQFSLDVLFYKTFLNDFADFFINSKTFITANYINSIKDNGFENEKDLHEQVQEYILKLNEAGYNKLTKDKLLSLLMLTGANVDIANEIITFFALKGELM